MKINITISIGEALDKLSILKIKKKHLLEKQKIDHVEKEMLTIEKAIQNLGDFREDLDRLLEVNQIMWDCNEKRKLKILNVEYDEEYFQMTIVESKMNDERFLIKNQINLKYNCDILEQKSYSWIN